MREAVEHAATLRQARHRATVELLVEEEARLLAVLEVDVVLDAVFAHDAAGGVGRDLPLKGKPALVERQALLLAHLGVVALVDAHDALAVLAQHTHKRRQDDGLQALHTHREHLRHENVLVTVDHKAWEAVGLGEDEAAAVGVGLAAGQCRGTHAGLAVLPSPAHLALPELDVEAVICVARHDAHANLRLKRDGTRAQVSALLVHHVHHVAVANLATVKGRGVNAQDLGVKDPHVTLGQEPGALLGDHCLGKGAALLHGDPLKLLENVPGYKKRPAWGRFAQTIWRRERDSNPRNGVAARRFSRPLQ